MGSLMLSAVLLVIPLSAGAACVYATNLKQAIDSASDVYKVADYIDPANPHNDRLLEAEYAKVNKIDGVKNNISGLQKKISPTGSFSCTSNASHRNLLSANVVFPEGLEGESKIIMSDVHALFKDGTCEQISEPMNCAFYPKSGFDEGDGIAVEKVIYPKPGERFKCPATEGESHLVLQLRSAPPAKTHYAVKDPNLVNLGYDEQVTVVTAQARDFWRQNPVSGKWEKPKNLSNCNLKEVTDMQFANNFNSACGAAEGASGAAVLYDLNGKSPVILGTVIGGDESLTTQQVVEIARTGKTDRRLYDRATWRTGNLAITEEVYQAIKDAAEQQVDQ
jgi:hypothetical protein